MGVTGVMPAPSQNESGNEAGGYEEYPSSYTHPCGIGNTRTPKRECHWLEVNRGPPGTPDWSPYQGNPRVLWYPGSDHQLVVGPSFWWSSYPGYRVDTPNGCCISPNPVRIPCWLWVS